MEWGPILSRLLAGEDLDETQASAAMHAMMSGESSPAQTAAFLVALRAKGESVDEITGLARTMREFSRKVETPHETVDTCGTGGDRAGTVNISTMAALVVAGAGVKVAKHGNRAASSQCGSADLLEVLGVAIDLEPDAVAKCIDDAGIGFCFAPVFHPAMRHVGPVRKELGISTVFNFLGPLTNPAGARRQAVGVSDERMAPLMAQALLNLGATHALVFRGDDGLDELTTTTTSRIWEVRDGALKERTFDPAKHGIARATADALAGADPAANAAACERILGGGDGPARDAVVLNAAAGLIVSGVAKDFDDGIAHATQSLDSGAAKESLDRMRDVSRALKA